MPINPYESPAAPTPLIPDPSHSKYNFENDLLRSWEDRRLWFNAILVAETLLIAILPRPLIFQPLFWLFALEGAIVANICFCVGPIATWYLSRIGFDKRRAGVLLFWLGTLLSMMLAIVAVVANFMPWLPNQM
jgi:hypothetical protein